MVRVGFKECPRCGGDLIHDTDVTEDQESYCIQCSYRPPTESKKVDNRYEEYLALRRLCGVGD